MEFYEFRDLQQKHFRRMVEEKERLFLVNVDADQLWDTYLDSFPEGTNQIFRERREFDCSCCRSFIRAFGGVVAISDNQLKSIWDFESDEKFGPVTRALSSLVKSTAVRDLFVSKEAGFGTDVSMELLEDNQVRSWSHFRVDLPKRFVISSPKSEQSIAAAYRDVRNVFKRSLDEINRDALVTVLDLISENTLYKGEEWDAVLRTFLALFDEYHTLPDDEKENYCWVKSGKVGGAVAKIRNHSIGVLLQNLSDGVDVLTAVRQYEAIVAPQNYKRPKAIFTKQMVDNAEKVVIELGLQKSLSRRYAHIDDVSISNVLWANRDAAKHMDGGGGVFNMLREDVPVKPNKYAHLPGVGVDRFVSDILPTASTLEVLLENRLKPSFVSLIAPTNKDAPTLFKWGNGFSWAYTGNVTDSLIKQRVKAAGGKVDGVLRFSLQWNDGEYNPNDFDAHCVEPTGNHIYFHNKNYIHPSSGMLDVDIVHPIAGTASVENIVWTEASRMPKGTYHLYVANYSHNGGRTGFTAEIEYDGTIYEYRYARELSQKEKVTVAKIKLDEQGNLTFLTSLPSNPISVNVWGLTTNRFHPVSMCMFSPNYWDGQKGIGHRHFFFMLAGCKSNERPNGFYNEYLRQDFMEHKKVFEALGAKMKVGESDNQLSGLGFSATKKNTLLCKVDGQIVKVVF